eukprot:scaffold16246_cov93-Isochrysis_galbana.AAC.3
MTFAAKEAEAHHFLLWRKGWVCVKVGFLRLKKPKLAFWGGLDVNRGGGGGSGMRRGQAVGVAGWGDRAGRE